MSFSVSCSGCELEWSGPPAVRTAPSAGGPAVPLVPRRGRPLAPNGGGRARRRQSRGTDSRLLRQRARLLRTLPTPLPDAARVSALVERTGAGARLSRGLWDPLLRTARHARLRRHRWQTVEGGAHTYVSALLGQLPGRVHLGLGVRAVRRRCLRRGARDRGRRERAASTRSCWPRTPTSRSRCSADPSAVERRLLGAWQYTTNEAVLHTDERFLPASRPHVRPGTTSSTDRASRP